MEANITDMTLTLHLLYPRIKNIQLSQKLYGSVFFICSVVRLTLTVALKCYFLTAVCLSSRNFRKFWNLQRAPHVTKKVGYLTKSFLREVSFVLMLGFVLLNHRNISYDTVHDTTHIYSWYCIDNHSSGFHWSCFYLIKSIWSYWT